MPTATQISIETMHKALAKQTPPTKRRSDPAQWVVEVGSSFPPLELETRPTVATGAAAYYLNRRSQTLRGWACLENGPVRPIRINGRLAWKTEDLRRLVGIAYPCKRHDCIGECHD